MKRLLFAALLGTATLVSFSSCKKEYITQEVNVLDGKSFVFNAKPSDWVKTGNTYRLDIPIKELDQAYYEDGHVSVAIINKDENPNAYEAIPALLYGYEYSYNYSIGNVRIYANDLSTPTAAPQNMVIKVVLTDAQIGN